MEKHEIKCMYCHYKFVAEPMVTKKGKKQNVYIECPRCGNGAERSYSTRKAKKYNNIVK